MNSGIENKKIHFVGIGGCGMSALAIAVSQTGANISGSDQKESIFTHSLREMGINVTIGHAESNTFGADLIVYSSAVKVNNIERQAAKRDGIEEIHRSGLIARLAKSQRTVAVCGAHGKTTTAALIAHILTECGRDPSYIVGGLPKPPMAHGRAGRSGILVIEADESDRSLLSYSPDILAVTNVDLDHGGDGGYASIKDVAQVFEQLGRQSKAVIASQSAAGILNLDNIIETSSGKYLGKGEFEINGVVVRNFNPGAHNVENSCLAMAVATQLGCEKDGIIAAVQSFPGLARRFDRKGYFRKGILVVDDYAHHPTEISAVISAAREITSGKVIVVFQPHLFSRTKQFAKEFADALSLADLALIENIYPSRESQKEWEDITREIIIAEAMAAGYNSIVPAPERSDLANYLESKVSSRDTVLTIGAGDISEVSSQLGVSQTIE